MLAASKIKESFFSFLIVFIFAVGTVLHLIPFTQKYVLQITDITLLLSNGIVLYFVFSGQVRRTLIYWSFFAFVLTYLTELAGINTGWIFGEYHYGRTMQIQILKVPLVIAINWVILIMASYAIVQSAKIKTAIVPFLSSGLIVGFDYIMEDVAMKLDYWQWKDDEIPIKNYFAWFLISLIFSGIMTLLKLKVETKILKLYFVVQLGFFLILRLFLL